MKIKDILCTLIISSIFIGAVAAKPKIVPQQQVVSVVRVDSVTAAKLKALSLEKSSIEAKIKTEDAKRNAAINGVSPETMEQLNIRQDSICLELRSQLVDINIELAEIKAQNKSNVISTVTK